MSTHRRSLTLILFLTLQALIFLMILSYGTRGLWSDINEDSRQLLAILTNVLQPTTREFSFTPYFRELYQFHPREAPSIAQAAGQADECGPFPYAKYFAQNLTRRSRHFEDKRIFDTFFKDVPLEELKTYKYIEIGGFTGMDESNSRFFETCLGWEGLLVEPNPIPFQKLLVNRPHAHRASYAVSCTGEDALANKTVAFHNTIFSNAAQSDTDNALVGRGTIDVPCGPIHPIVLDVLGPSVQFFSLDVEGAEPMVLRAIDFSAVFIEVMMIEVSNNFCMPLQPCKQRTQVREIMQSNGYHRFEGYIPASDLYVHPQSRFLSKMAGKRVSVNSGV
jgi:FkbM family methyltransferase